MKILISISVVFLLFNIFGWILNVGAVNQIDNHTAREETEGEEIWEKLQTKKAACSELPESDFNALGEYFMGQMAGDTQKHATMNQMMTEMMGEEGGKQMHIAMGKRISGCQPNISIPQKMMNNGIMPTMMNMMMGNFGNNSIGWWGFGLGWIFMILFWILVIVGIVALIKWLINQSKGGEKNGSALEILKERYAKGEINKKEFEERKKDLI